jgi:hypothetical protein
VGQNGLVCDPKMTHGYVDIISVSVVMAICMGEQVLDRAVEGAEGDRLECERERALKKPWRCA